MMRTGLGVGVNLWVPFVKLVPSEERKLIENEQMQTSKSWGNMAFGSRWVGSQQEIPGSMLGLYRHGPALLFLTPTLTDFILLKFVQVKDWCL